MPDGFTMSRIRAIISNRFPALASRDFAIFWGGHLLSLIGTSMQNTAQPLLAYRISGRPFDLGLIGFALTLPAFFLALPGGVWIERWDKRKTVIILQIVMMFDTLALAALTLTGRVQIWHIVLLAFILGIATAFEVTARQSMLIELVGRDALPNAIALQSTAFNISRVIGPSLAAPFLLIFTNGEGWIFLVNGLSFIAIIIGLTFVRTRYKEETLPPPASFLQQLRDGQKYIARTTSVGMIILIAAILALFALPITQQIPVLAKDVLASPGEAKSIVDARNSTLYVAQGAGALVAAFLVTMNNSTRWHRPRLLLGEAAFLLGMLGMGFVRVPWIAYLLIAFMGWGSVTQLATMNTLIQLQVPNELRGRVFGMYLWALNGAAPLGSLMIGWMTQTWGLPVTALTCGTICLIGIGGIQIFKPPVKGSG